MRSNPMVAAHPSLTLQALRLIFRQPYPYGAQETRSEPRGWRSGPTFALVSPKEFWASGSGHSSR